MIETYARPKVFIAIAHGEWDTAATATIERMLARAAEWPAVVIDLADLRFLDLRGARPIEELTTRCRSSGSRLFLLNPRRGPLSVLRFLGLERIVVPLERLPDPIAADELFARQGRRSGPGASS